MLQKFTTQATLHMNNNPLLLGPCLIKIPGAQNVIVIINFNGCTVLVNVVMNQIFFILFQLNNFSFIVKLCASLSGQINMTNLNLVLIVNFTACRQLS